MKGLISILSLLLALNLGTTITVEKSCGMTGCSISGGKMTCCKVSAGEKPCCTSKYSCSKSEFDGTYQPAVQVNIAKQTTVYVSGEITFIPNTASLLKIDNFKRQKFKPDLQLNTILLI